MNNFQLCSNLNHEKNACFIRQLWAFYRLQNKRFWPRFRLWSNLARLSVLFILILIPSNPKTNQALWNRQMYELCLRSYNMLVLDGAFMSHGNRCAVIPMDVFYRRLAIITNTRKYKGAMVKLLKRYVGNSTEDRCSRGNLTSGEKYDVLRRKFYVYCRCTMTANNYPVQRGATLPLDSYISWRFGDVCFYRTLV